MAGKKRRGPPQKRKGAYAEELKQRKQLGFEIVSDWTAQLCLDILVQLPLPRSLHERGILGSVYHSKDVDCFTAVNVGHMILGDANFIPCTPGGIMHLLRHYEIPIAGKHCVIVGRSNIVGKPLTHLMLQSDATVTV